MYCIVIGLFTSLIFLIVMEEEAQVRVFLLKFLLHIHRFKYETRFSAGNIFHLFSSTSLPLMAPLNDSY